MTTVVEQAVEPSDDVASPGEPTGVRAPWPGRAVVLGSGLAMFLVGLWGLNRGSMWQDESATFDVAHRSVGQIVALLGQVDVVHGLYYLFMHGWLAPGGGEVWMRVPSLLAMSVAGGAVAAVGLRVAGIRVGLVAGLLFAASPPISFYAQEGRSTALVTAAVLLATLCLIRVGMPDGVGSLRRWWIAYGSAMAVAVVLHEFAILALAAHGVTLLLNRAPRSVWARWLWSAALCVLLVVPIAVLSSEQAGQVSWLRRPSLATLGDLAGQLFGATPVLLVATLVLIVVGVVGELRRRRTTPAETWSIASVALPVLLVPIVMLLTASLVQPLFHVRYVLYAAAGVPLLVASGLDVVGTTLDRVTRRRYVGTIVVALAVVALAATQIPQLRFVRTVESRDNDLAAAAAVIGSNSRPGDGVVFMPLRYRAAALAYPGDFSRVHDLAIARTGIDADNLRGTDLSRRAVAKNMRAAQRIWVVGRSGLTVRATGEPGAVNEQAVLRQGFVKVASYPVHGMQVALYERKGR